MNYLAHLFLAPNSIEHRVGSLLGDFARGLQVEGLERAVVEGLEHHRAVDVFTDSHPQVRQAKTLFSAHRRRFAGVALDVLFDHYLLRHWATFSSVSVDGFIAEVYQDLNAGYSLMPAKMGSVTQRIIHDDWFNSYKDLESVGYALDRIAGRIRFPNQFCGIIEDIRAHDDELEVLFLNFFPDLQALSDRLNAQCQLESYSTTSN